MGSRLDRCHATLLCIHVRETSVSNSFISSWLSGITEGGAIDVDFEKLVESCANKSILFTRDSVMSKTDWVNIHTSFKKSISSSNAGEFKLHR